MWGLLWCVGIVAVGVWAVFGFHNTARKGWERGDKVSAIIDYFLAYVGFFLVAVGGFPIILLFLALTGKDISLTIS